jgi:hypothetical protein
MKTIKIDGRELTYRQLNFGHIMLWCQENNQVAWLKVKVHETVGDRKISYIEVKRDWALTFAPEIVPVAKPKKKSMIDLVDAL